MKDGHLLSQHAVSGHEKRERDGCRDGDKRARIRKKERQRELGKKDVASLKRRARERERL